MKREKTKTKNIKTDPLGDALTTSEEMKPYIDAHVAQVTGKGLQDALSRIRALPIDRRYIVRVMNNLDVALADMDSETACLDIEVLPIAQAVEMLEKMRFRLMQLQMLTKRVGEFIAEKTEHGGGAA